MKKLLSLLGVVFVLTACTNKDLYQYGQSYQKDQCIAQAKNAEAYNKCLEDERERKSYEDYEEERKVVTQK